jgi:hypothetical protein
LDSRIKKYRNNHPEKVKKWKKDHYKNNKEKILKRMKEWYWKLWLDTIDHYGGKCSCCGESNPMFLTMDHINNDGYIWRRNIYKERGYNNKRGTRGVSTTVHLIWIRKNNYPKDLQLLCFNCNCGKNRNKGVCPHYGIIEYLEQIRRENEKAKD